MLRKRFVNPNEAAVTSKAEQRVHISDEFLYNKGDSLAFRVQYDWFAGSIYEPQARYNGLTGQITAMHEVDYEAMLVEENMCYPRGRSPQEVSIDHEQGI
ncbi:MAG TPA: hypothetical protein VMW24_04010 [Sedimentisphaerales bacterium]|nr:hypothetical protein [Sedimentisphaerales bacterium]